MYNKNEITIGLELALVGSMLIVNAVSNYLTKEVKTTVYDWWPTMVGIILVLNN